jgi:hypothetical protein
MPHHRSRYASLMFLIALLLCDPVASHAKEPAAPAASISQTMRDFVAKGEISGAVTLVARDGEVMHLGADGYANLEDGKAKAFGK